MIHKKDRNVAVCAIARKMVIVAWHQMNGHGTNGHIPEKNLDVKKYKSPGRDWTGNLEGGWLSKHKEF